MAYKVVGGGGTVTSSTDIRPPQGEVWKIKLYINAETGSGAGAINIGIIPGGSTRYSIAANAKERLSFDHTISYDAFLRISKSGDYNPTYHFTGIARY